jgi:hypothetical protein
MTKIQQPIRLAIAIAAIVVAIVLGLFTGHDRDPVDSLLDSMVSEFDWGGKDTGKMRRLADQVVAHKERAIPAIIGRIRAYGYIQRSFDPSLWIMLREIGDPAHKALIAEIENAMAQSRKKPSQGDKYYQEEVSLIGALIEAFDDLQFMDRLLEIVERSYESEIVLYTASAALHRQLVNENIPTVNVEWRVNPEFRVWWESKGRELVARNK